MKKLKRTAPLALFMAVLLLLFCVFARAEDAHYSEQYYRVIDYADVLEDNEYANLDERALELVSGYGMDVAVMTVTPAEYAGTSMSALADADYASCDFGYGPEKTGFMVVYDVETNELLLNTYGRADEIITEDFKPLICEAALNAREEHGVWGVLWMPIMIVTNNMESTGTNWLLTEADTDTAAASEEITRETAEEAAESSASEVRADSKPLWYPEDVDTFTFYNRDAAEPRVLDEADIFTEEEELQMDEIIRRIQQTYGKDMVVYTTASSYGMDLTTLAMDFYDFCGYGFGNDNEGMCLAFIMDPNARGFRVVATGPETEALYTKANADFMDDRLYSYASSAKYGSGVINWLTEAETMCRTGYASVPVWYDPAVISGGSCRNDTACRVTDAYNDVSDAELEKLEAWVNRLKEKTGIDIAIHFEPKLGQLTEAECAEAYYKTMGYGMGEDNQGILLLVNRRYGVYSYCYIYEAGSRYSRFTDTNLKRLERYTERAGEYGTPYEVAEAFLKDLEHIADTGRAIQPVSHWLWVLFLALIFGLIVAGILLSRACKRMVKPELSVSAAEYLVRNTLQVTVLSDTFIRRRTESHYDPIQRDSDSSGSSSSSSYSSSSTGSSGRSHTTSGRNF